MVFDAARVLRASRVRVGPLRVSGAPAILLGVAAVILSMPLISLWLLIQPTLSAGEAAAAIGLIGFAVGVEYDLIAYLVARYFGMRAYTTIYSILYMCFGVGAGFAPFIFGWSFDRAHSYVPILETAAALLLVSVLSLLTLGGYRTPVTTQQQGKQEVAFLKKSSAKNF